MRKLPDVIKLIRDKVPQLKDALVTHAANEPYPVSQVVQVKTANPQIKNLLGAGIWASEASSELILCIVSLTMLKSFPGNTRSSPCFPGRDPY